jgi:hypothetical protein
LSLGARELAHDIGGYRRRLRPFVSTQVVEGHLLPDIGLDEVSVEPPEGLMQARCRTEAPPANLTEKTFDSSAVARSTSDDLAGLRTGGGNLPGT